MKQNIWSALWLSLIIFLVFFLQATIKPLTNLFILDTSLVIPRIWTLISAIFLHGDIAHLFYNLFGLALFGTVLEHIIGTKRFLILFFAAGLTASLISLPFYNRVLGASGAIFGILGMLALLRPKMFVWVYGMPMPMIAALFVWGAADVLGIFAPSGTANIAHLGGLGLGLIAGVYYRNQFSEKKTKKDIYIDEKKVKDWEKGF